MNRIVTGQEMSAIDKYTIEQLHIPSLVLMERAALSVVKEIESIDNIYDKTVGIICGIGNNGGDGLAIGRMLKELGIKCNIYVLGIMDKCSLDFNNQLNILKAIDIEVTELNSNNIEEINKNDIIVDAIFGTGLGRNIEGFYKEVIDIINNSGSYIISVDTPSGVCSNTGHIKGIAIEADKTVTFGSKKIGQLLYPGAEYTNELIVADIGFPKKAYNIIDSSIYEYNDSYKKYLPERVQRSNKGTYGKVLIIAGSKNMCGAAYLSANAAYRTGSGLVTIVTDEANRQILQTSIPEAVLKTYEIIEGEINKNSIEEIEQCISQADAIVIGPGLGNDYKTKQLLKLVLEKSKVPVIIDADGINVISDNRELLNKLDEKVVLTPHLGEMSRLIDKPIKYIQDHMLEVSTEIVKKYLCNCILKDARTITSTYNNKIFINTSGNNGMATAGSGDVLTGIIGSLVGQGLSIEEASSLGVYIHGLAGDKGTASLGNYALTANDIINNIGETMK